TAIIVELSGASAADETLESVQYWAPERPSPPASPATSATGDGSTLKQVQPARSERPLDIMRARKGTLTGRRERLQLGELRLVQAQLARARRVQLELVGAGVRMPGDH